jgi:membrane-bound acyltransferase YfiQ involved in biofilm formation
VMGIGMGMEKRVVEEVFLLRGFACLSIVMLHSLTRIYSTDNTWVNGFSLLLTFGTPTFVFISELLLSLNYSEKLPGGFWRKRVLYLFLPYLFFGTFYALTKAAEQSVSGGLSYLPTFFRLLWRHILLGDFHGYFILVIFQFYVLHMLFQKYVYRSSPLLVLCVSLLVNLLYLGFFNFVKPFDFPHAEYIWEKGYWNLFPGWIFYFSLAYYSGRYYTLFKELLSKFTAVVLIAPVVIGAVTVTFNQIGFLDIVSSKRVDMLFFTSSMIIFLYWLAMKFPRILLANFASISQYSFGIYLFHPFYLAILIKVPLPFLSAIQTLILFLGSIFASVISVYVIQKIPFGSLFVGRIGVGSYTKHKKQRRKELKPIES